MGAQASMALFGLYSLATLVGIIGIMVLKKETNILKASTKILIITFLATIIIGLSVFTYLNFTATQENYEWMHDGLLYQQMGQS